MAWLEGSCAALVWKCLARRSSKDAVEVQDNGESGPNTEPIISAPDHDVRQHEVKGGHASTTAAPNSIRDGRFNAAQGWSTVKKITATVIICLYT